MGDNNALSRLQPAQVRELREGFQTLDRDSDGQVGRDDVADMLTQLGGNSSLRYFKYDVLITCHRTSGKCVRYLGILPTVDTTNADAAGVHELHCKSSRRALSHVGVAGCLFGF